MTNHITLSDFPASCSCMKLTSKQGRPYWFRTCDLNTSIWDAGAHAVSFPADYAITAANGTLRTRYALLGMSYCTVDSWLLDGVNSEGLVGGLLLLEEGTSVTAAEAGSSGVMGMELVTALLATCRNVTEVCQAAKDIRITDIPAETGFLPATMHYFFLDATGNTVAGSRRSRAAGAAHLLSGRQHRRDDEFPSLSPAAGQPALVSLPVAGAAPWRR